MRSKTLKIALSFVLLAGCKVQQDSLPESSLSLPETYETAVLDSASNSSQIVWTEFFQDEKLKSLIQAALDNNQDNQQTLLKINAARASMLRAKRGILPSISLNAGAAQRKFGEYTMDGVGNADTNLSDNVPADKKIPSPYKDFVVGAEFSWEIDVWGKLRSRKKAAVARLMASEEMSRSIQTWLISEVASNYYHLLAIDQEIEVLKENISLQELALQLITELKEGGKANQLAIDQFEALVLNTKAQLQAKNRELKSAEYNLARLVGTLDFSFERMKLDQAITAQTDLETGLPAELIQYRPDLKEAEMQLEASKADVHAAKAAFYPSFNLFGMAGFNAFDFSKLFLSPGSGIYQFGAGLTAPLFNRREIRSLYEVAKADQQIALLEYEKKTLNAYLEVLDLINQMDTYDQQLKMKQYEVSVLERAIEHSNTLFSVGYANYLEVINAQSRTLESAIELADLKASRLQANVKLYKALGGGWN
ncbi:efflux transporter outer membrane subunit [Algoriphagus vanfongensis]|uniref:efflux transporter outer membrane subunit n=1 Tax=Algoriphagus vanfongensis TaxID=426371 RepID=UPI00040EB7DE|nr:efflux transporter outer membrane subunit [Algoriphagus vanfongensis]